MADVQINQFPEKANPVDDDVVHLKSDSDNGDYKTKISSLKTKIVTDNIASVVEAQAGTDDTKLMTPKKSQDFLTVKIATVPEAEGISNNTKVITPSRLDSHLKVNRPYLTERHVPVTGGGALTESIKYRFEDSLTYTLPDVTGFVGGESVSGVKLVAVSPEIEVEGSNGEIVRINEILLDSSFTYDANTEIEVIYNSSTNEWEI